jgi:hypothetical protein
MTSKPIILNQKEKKTMMIVGIAFLFFLITILFRDELYFVAKGEHYLSLHTILEFFSITISFAIAIQGWMIFPHHLSRHRLWYSGTFLAIGMIDLLHTLSYKGMPGLIITGSSVQKATWFWITARLTQACMLFLIMFFPNKQTNTKQEKKYCICLFTSLCIYCFLYYHSL